jgi:DNA-binding LytR/AlgR family response regulator
MLSATPMGARMAAGTQDYKSHRQFVPLFHFFVVPILLINLGVEISRLIHNQDGDQIWAVIVAMALAGLAFATRGMAVKALDRIIRLEERLRLSSLLPAEQRDKVNDLTPSQLVALRFASDEEAPDLAQRTMTGEFKTQNDIKKAIRNWRADLHRV